MQLLLLSNLNSKPRNSIVGALEFIP